MAEQPPLSRIHVIGYSANDRSFPILAQVLDPRVAGYQVPKDLSACPDKRYPNHVFTGAQPISGDERVRHVWEILPSPYIPFTRYDDDLGPVQGRRRSVKNEGQVAVREADKQVTYDAREGSAIVYTELEETWSIKTDEDGNSLFPIRDRDFYDASRGPIQERRQLFVPTGEEEGSLENVNGVITQTSYEPYNDFLSIKIVQTYKVNGPQLIGKATDNDGQLVTVTTQRKGSDGYVPPNPTATRTVEVNREDAESLVERIVDTPEIFKANTFSVERPDPIPQKFRVAVPIQSSQEIVEGTADTPTLEEGDISKSEEQRNKFIKRVSSTSRDQAVLPQTLTGKSTNNERQEVTVTETLQLGNTNETPTATKTVESEALGDGNYVITKTEVDEVFSALTLSKERPDPVPQKFRVTVPISTREENLEGEAEEPTLTVGQIAKSEQQVNQFVKRVATTARDATQLPRTVTQKVTTNEGLLASVTETLQTGDTTVVPTSKRTVESEALGDGTYVVRLTEAPEVFAAQVYRAEKADLTPQKFRSKQQDSTKEENIEGTAAPIGQLGENEFSKSEQQINKFVKRVTTNTRTTELNETLNESVLTTEGQLATRTITLAKSPQTIAPSATLVDGNVEELGDGRTVKTEIKVNQVFDGKQESLEKPEVIPPEFRASLQNKTISEIKAGQSVSVPSLSQDELSKTIQRITEHKIRETTTTRPATSYPSLTGQLVDNDLIKVSRTRTVVKGNQTITPSATVSGTVEALGDGYTLKTEDTKEKVFEAKTFSKEKPDNIPVEFRAEKPVTITEITEEGEAQEVSLFGDEISKSEQQITDFLKRTRTTTRDIVGGVTLEGGEQIDQDGIKVTVTRTLQNGSQSIAPSATTSGQVEAIGDGKTIKTELEKSEVFNAKTITLQQAFQLPDKFVTGEIEEESFIEGATSAIPDALGDSGTGVVQSTAQRVTAFTVRKTKRTVDGETSVTERQLNNNGQEITIESSVSSDSSIETGATVEIARAQSIGGGKFLKEIGRVDEVFDSKQKTLSQSVQVPSKFFNGKATETSTVEAGEEAEPEDVGEDGFGITRSSAQRVNAFLVRKTQTEQSGVTSLTEKQTNNAKQTVTVTSSITDDTSIDPSATTEFIRIQSIGGGKFVKEEGKVNEIFPNKSFSKQIPDPAPQKFRIELPALTTEITEEAEEVEEGDANLEKDDLEKSVQQIDKFTKRTRTTTRDATPDGILVGKQTGQWGEETLTETYNENEDIESGWKILSNRKTPLGGGKFLGEKVEVSSPTSLVEKRIDPETQIEITITKELVAPNHAIANPPYGSAELVPIDAFNSVYIKTEVSNLPSNEIYETTIDFSFPNKLTRIGVDWETSTSGDAATGQTLNNEAILENGLSWRVSQNATARCDANASPYFEVEQGYSGPVKAQVTRVYSFGPPTTIAKPTKINAVFGTVTISGRSASTSKGAILSGNGGTAIARNGSVATSASQLSKSFSFGPVVHNGITLENEEATGYSAGKIQTASAITNIPSGGGAPPLTAGASASTRAELYLPASTLPFESGDEIIAMVKVYKWKFNIWITETYKAYHP